MKAVFVLMLNVQSDWHDLWKEKPNGLQRVLHTMHDLPRSHRAERWPQHTMPKCKLEML